MNRCGEDAQGDAAAFRRGYVAGLVGRTTELHALYYGAHWHFGAYFETKVATELAAFVDAYDESSDGLWSYWRDGRAEAAIAIDGERGGGADGVRRAHLRWFIVSEALRGQRVGGRLLRLALDFCRERRFGVVYLWTFRGLEAAAHLYRQHGFVLTAEHPGTTWGSAVVEQRYELRPR